MNFLARFIRLLFWVVIVSWGVRMLGRVVSALWQSGRSPASPESASDNQPAQNALLVRDPICGVHIAQARAIPLRENDELLHFCSTDCRDQYVNGSRTLAANG
jgi:hypothetical protein